MDRIGLATKPMNVGSKLFELLIPKAIAVVEMDVTETSVLKLFDQSIVSCEFVKRTVPPFATTSPSGSLRLSLAL